VSIISIFVIKYFFLKKQKYYVVWKGVNPGVYNDWNTAKKQIDGFQGALYKSFESKSEADYAFTKDADQFISYTAGKPKSSPSKPKDKYNIIQNSIAVDAACSGNPGDMEYRGVITATGKELFHMGPFSMGTNNIGEFLAIVHGAAFLKQYDKLDTVIYTDSKTAIAWIRDKKLKTTLQPTNKNKEVFMLIDKALKWLSENKIANPIVHWQTQEWGEIPADFGRK
jgi:ribonuclease HI